MKKFSSIATFLFLLGSVFSQNSDLDKLFQEARENAFANNIGRAQKLCYQILQQNKNYVDARILLARTFSWDQKYDSARNHLKVALRQDPYAVDAYLALADVENWSGKCYNTIALCDSALKKIPNNYDLSIKRIKAFLCSENALSARSSIESLLKVYPINLEIQNLLKQAKQGTFKNRLIVEHSFEFFEEPYVRRWHVSSLQYQHDEKWGTVIAKVNAGQLVPSSGELFDPYAIQYEADFYPMLGKGFYSYMNYGYSNGDLFPEHRGGLELFKSFRGGVEISAGGRYLYLHNGNEVIIYTGSLSKYFGKWWLSARPYLSEINNEWDQSYFLFIRRYSSQYNYLGGMLGYGTSPDLLPNSIGILEMYTMDSYQARLDFQQRLGNHFLFRTLAGYGYDQHTTDTYRHRFNIQGYLAYMF